LRRFYSPTVTSCLLKVIISTETHLILQMEHSAMYQGIPTTFPNHSSPPQIGRAELSVGQKLEAVFLSEMLKASGVGETPSAFGGGVGEDQFASFLRDAQAREMVRAGGLGLALHFDQAIKEAVEK
jgi:hypothetical protein